MFAMRFDKKSDSSLFKSYGAVLSGITIPNFLFIEPGTRFYTILNPARGISRFITVRACGNTLQKK